MDENVKYHTVESQRAVERLGSDPEKGLGNSQIKERQEKYGKNVLPEAERFSVFHILIEQFKSPLIYILIIAGFVTFFMGELTDSLVIFAAVFVNTAFGFWEENKVSKILKKLEKTLKTKATVLRGGKKKEVFQKELVVGDIVFFEAGAKIPADGRLLQTEDLKIEEAVLTGEWLPQKKHTDPVAPDTPLADRENMVYMGSLVRQGKGKALITAVGSDSEVGRIATLVKETEETKTPLQKKLADFSKIIGGIIAVICLLIFAGGTLRGGDALEMFESSVAVAVGGIPEALPVVMTLILAIGMEKILKKQGLVRKLASVETLGSTEVICFDKTRTLTEGKMMVSDILAGNEELARKAVYFCSQAYIENPEAPPDEREIRGSPTDVALFKAGMEKGFYDSGLEDSSPEIKHLPFDSSYKYQASLRREGDGYVLYVCGAPEVIFSRSRFPEEAEEQTRALTEEGLRVLAAAHRSFSKKEIDEMGELDLKELAQELDFIGLLALRDTIRKEVPRAIKVCRQAGMIPIMVTGDHKLTAKTIAREVGFDVEEENILEGRDLDKMSPEELASVLDKIYIYARVEPKHKMRIISQWQERGRVVAMTGDGVNDAPAIKKADIGVALGSGTEVAKESSDLILLNDSFAIIIDSIEQGRVILDNLQKAISYVLADSFASVILVGMAKVVFGWPLPILPVQILWNNIVEDTLPNMAYSFEPPEKGVMQRKPLPSDTPLLNKEMKVLIFFTGIIDQLLPLVIFWFLWGKLGYSLDYVRTLVFGALCIDTAFVVYSYKSLRKNIWQIDLFSNKQLNFAVLVVILSLIAAIYFPPLQRVLHTVPLGFMEWCVLVGVGFVSTFLIEVTKWYFIARHEVGN
ncbi:MAG: HAD-IC family P-type ATPase [Candidatus Nealsonbacteria bacterium]|nr:HAD-IC family P-type ATPase [Candidatus Nealsonbacteria bacterium]